MPASSGNRAARPSDTPLSREPSAPYAAPSPYDSGSYEALPEGAVYDAVFEDLVFEDLPQAAPEARRPSPSVGPEAAVFADVVPPRAEAHASPEGDGFGPVPDPGFVPDPGVGDGFKIGPGEAPASAALALRRPAAALPAVVPGAPPPPPPVRPPRLQAREEFRDKAEALFRSRRLIAGLALGAMLAALAFSLATDKTYESYSILLINPQRPAGSDDALVGAFVDVPGEEGRKVLNQAIILQQAPAIADRTARRLLAAGEPLTFADALRGAPTVENVSAYLQMAVVKVKPEGEQVDALRVTAESGSAEEAARIAALYTEEYAALAHETGRARITATRQFLEEQVARRQGELDEVESLIADYMTTTRSVGLDAQTQSAIGQIATLQAGLDQARIEARLREATIRSLEGEMQAVGTRMTVSGASTAESEIRQLDTQITELERVVEQIYLRNPDYRGRPEAHPDLYALENRLDRLRHTKRTLADQLARDVSNSGGIDPLSTGSNGRSFVSDLRRQIASERAALEGARAEADALSGRLASASGALTRIPEQSRELAQLQRSRAATEQLVLYLTQKLQEARVAEETDFGLVQVVREAQVPERPASPNTPRNVALFGLLGLLVGLAGAAVRYRTDGRLHAPSDLEAHAFTVVGVIPDLGREAEGAAVAVEGHRVPPTLVSLTRPFSPAAEAFRHLHAALQGTVSPQVLLVTGAEVGCGKSLTAANLAVAAAQGGRRVLLVDADLRRPSVHAYLGLGAAPALGEGIESENLVYWNTMVPGLFALTVKGPALAPEDLWGPEQAARLLGNLRQVFDLIVIDAPPSLVAADAYLLAPHCDAALLVAAAGKTDADALGQVAGELAGTGLRQIGAVLNRFDPNRTLAFRRTFGYRYATAYAADVTASAGAPAA